MRIYPNITEYEKEIKKVGGKCLNLPHQYEFIPNTLKPIKIYKVASGAFAGVFKIKDINTGKFYALRVFLNTATSDKISRITHISSELQKLSESWLCKTEFYQKGISIGGEKYPIILMEWSNGIRLNDYVSNIISNRDKISEVQNKIVELSHRLEELEIAHGDIQSGNILVEESTKGIQLKLVDYDPMYISSLKGKKAIEVGHSSFQHPKRNKSHYDETIDRFSFWLIITALEAIKYDKTLWNKDMQGGFNDEDNFLFKAIDLERPHSSKLINRLEKLNKSSLNHYLKRLLESSTSPIRQKISLYEGNSTESIKPIRPIIKPSPIGRGEETKPKPLSNNNFIIKSKPSGAVIEIGDRLLGYAPLELNIIEYSAKKIKVTYQKEYKEIYLNKNQKEYLIDFTLIKKANDSNKWGNMVRETKGSSNAMGTLLNTFFIIFLAILLLIFISVALST